MLRSRVLFSATVGTLAVLALGLAVGHRVGSTGAARPVVRQTFVVTLDPEAPDFIAGSDREWVDLGFDDASWGRPESRGVDHVAGGIPRTEGIWPTIGESFGRFFFRRAFVADATAAATLTIDCDNAYLVYVNGAFVGSDNVWGSPESFDVGTLVNQGQNVVAVEGLNLGGVGSLACRIAGDFGSVVSDSSWRYLDPGAEESATLAGSAWARIEVPGLRRSSQLSACWIRSEGAAAYDAPELSRPPDIGPS